MNAEYLKSLISYNKNTGEFKWKAKNKIKAGKTGWKDKDGYLHIRIDYKLYRAHRLAWLYVYGVFPDEAIDHIDRNPSNNKIENLRLCNKRQNAINSKMRSDNTSGYRGVRRRPGMKKWQARAYFEGKEVHLGYFDTAEEASEVYKKKVIELNGGYTESTQWKI